MTRVTVYYFQKYDIVTDKNVRSQRPATLETIAKCGGEAIKETALEVDKARLDGDGFLTKES